jgi:AraC family transcriptional regulator, alkane utilization regulator
MDVLTDVLQTVRVSSVCYGRLELTAPWGFRAESAGDALFHVVLRGGCVLEVDGVEGDVLLSSGDLVALPHGNAHVVRDAKTSSVRALSEILACKSEPSVHIARYGGGGAAATLVSGAFHFDDRRNNPVLEVLPPLVLIRGEHGRAVEWLEPTLQFIASEAASQQPGAKTVISRLADILFIQLVRGYLASDASAGRGWLRALAEPQIGAALRLIHQQPAHAWTVALLAQRVGMSRSTFAGRFRELIGEAPLHYVTRWRMRKAAGLLLDGRTTLAEIADRVGYESEAAFSKTFKRWMGSAPGAYRKAAQARGAIDTGAPRGGVEAAA